MTQKRFSAKIVLSIVAVLLIIGTMSTVAFAASFEDMAKANYSCSYGQAVPTDDKLNAKVSQYNFNGDEGTLYFMQISKGKANSFYAVEIFSDSGYQTKIRSFSKQFSTTAGNTPLKIKWEFKTTVSGTYYGRCYTYVETKGSDGATVQTVDTSSISTFKININRVGTKTVKLKSLVNSATGPKLTWEPLPTGTKYNVYRKAAGDKSWTYLTTLAGAASTYVDTKAVSGKDYTYTVKCGDNKYTSKYDTKGLTIKFLSMPKISVMGSGTAGTAVVKWDAVAGAQGYYVYRKGGNLSNYNWKLIATIKNGKTVSYTDKSATSTDWNYTYTVKAYNGKTVSAYNYNGVDFDYIKAPTIKRVSSNYGGMLIEWTNNNENVKGYYVYRLNGKTWKYLGQTTAKSFIDKTAESTKSYTYTVKAFSDTNAGGYNAKGVTAKYIAAPVLASKVTFDASYRSIVKWNAVDGAQGYIVYRKINNAKAWTAVKGIKDAKTTVFYDSCKKASGDKITYTVRAYDKANLFSYFNTNGISGVCLAKPYFTAAQTSTEDNSLAILVSWGKINGATKYNVYRRPAGTAIWAYQKTVAETSYLDTTVENGSTYEYAVRALNDTGSQSEFYVQKATAITIPVISNVIAINSIQSQFSRISWGIVDGAESYNIYRMAKDGTEWEKLDNTTEKMYTDKSEGASTTAYYYAVTTVIGDLESAMSAPFGNFAEVTLEATATDDGIQLDWSCGNFTGADITRENNEEITIIDVAKGTYTYTDISAEKGETYTYTISVKVGGKVNGVASATVRRPHDPLAQTVITSIDNATVGTLYGARINWLKVDFAEKYVVLRASDNGFLDWEEIGTLTNDDVVNGELSFVDNTIIPNKEYAYKIKAQAPVADRPESESEYKTTILLSHLDSLTNVKATVATGTENKYIELSWSPVSNAEGYKIYRTNSPEIEASWVEVGSIDLGHLETNTEDYVVTDNTIEANGTYSYKIVAWSTDRGEVFNVSDGVEITGFPEEETPDEPETPNEPETPVDPENPGEGEGTEEPTNPDTPANPDTPEDGGETTEPTDPDDNTGNGDSEDDGGNPGMGVI